MRDAALPRRITRSGPALVAALVVVVSALGFAWLADAVREHDGVTTRDPGVLDFFVDARSGVLVRIARVVTDLGSAPVVVVGALAAAWLLWRRGAPLVWSLVPPASVALAAALTTIGKAAFGRARPPASLRLVTETEPSFPSGHTGDTTALLVAIALVVVLVVARRPLVRALVAVGAAAGSVAMGLSRLELGVHWPTDVVAGWAVGVGVAAAVVGAAWLVAPADLRRG